MAIVCEICGGSLIKNGDSFKCMGCGIKYSAEDVRKFASASKISTEDLSASEFSVQDREDQTEKPGSSAVLQQNAVGMTQEIPEAFSESPRAAGAGEPDYLSMLDVEAGTFFRIQSAPGECLSMTTKIFYALTFLEDYLAIDTLPKRKNTVPEIRYTEISAVSLKTSLNFISLFWAAVSILFIFVYPLIGIISFAVNAVYVITNKKLSIILNDGRTAVVYHNTFSDQLWKNQAYNELVGYLNKIADINNKRIGR